MAMRSNAKLIQDKMHSPVRRVLVEPIDEIKTKRSMVDTRLYKGGNSLRLVQHPMYTTWTFKYEHGMLPQALKDQKFTRFSDAVKEAEKYLNSQGLRVIGTEDVWDYE